MSMIIDLIPPGVKMDIADSHKATPIHYSVRRGVDPEAIRKLVVQHKMNINAAHENGNTALHYAVTFQNMEAIKLLVCNTLYHMVAHLHREFA